MTHALWRSGLALRQRSDTAKAVTLSKFLQKIEDELIFIQNNTSHRREAREAWFQISESFDFCSSREC
jgi:hypothetical protein